MGKTSKKQMHRDEKKVLSILEMNAKENIDNIAKKCGFSRQKVWRIVKRLEKDKTIWGYTAITDTESLGLKNYVALIKKTNEPVQKLADLILSREVEKKGREMKIYVSQSEYLHGSYDWLLCFSAPDIKDAKKFCELLNTAYDKHIRDLILIERIFSVKKFGINNPNMKRLKDFV